MKISDQNASVNIDAYINQVKKNQTGDPAVDAAGQQQPQTDSVELSQTARELKAARKHMEQIADIRADKVAHLKAQIEKGAYSINTDKLAQKLISESLFNDID
jgi:negative regulator of flagellin synthesis FlgM